MSRILRQVRPMAWVIEEVAFLKHGRYSAGVERQYIHSLGKVCNSQLAITVALTTSQLSVPVNWRLVIPDAWGRDEERRSRARMPEDELPRPYWQYPLELLDDMALDWGMPRAPILVDARNRGGAEALFAALAIRGMPYLAEVSPGIVVRREGVPALQGRIGGAAGSRWSAEELGRSSTNSVARETVEWRDDDGRLLRSQFMQVPVTSGTVGSAAPRSSATSPSTLLVEWPFGKPQPRGFWLTNITDAPLAELVGLAKLRNRVRGRIEDFAERFGLRDYEGRTFAGWHHHVTLTTAAYVYHLMESSAQGRRDQPSGLLAYRAGAPANGSGDGPP